MNYRLWIKDEAKAEIRRTVNFMFDLGEAYRAQHPEPLSAIDQSVFCAYNKEVIFPVPGGWGKKGATFIDLKKVNKSMFTDALATAWKTVAPAKLAEKYFGKENS